MMFNSPAIFRIDDHTCAYNDPCFDTACCLCEKEIRAKAPGHIDNNEDHVCDVCNSVLSIDVTVEAPVAEKDLATEATADVEPVDIELSWNPADTTADYSTEYTVDVTATADDGYVFDSNVIASVNGETVDADLDDNGVLKFSYTFEETEPSPTPDSSTPAP